MTANMNSQNFKEQFKQPSSRLLVSDTSNFEEAKEAVEKTYCIFRRMEMIGNKDTFRFRLHRAPLKNLAITRQSFGADTHIETGSTETFFMIALSQTGSIDYWHGGKSVESNPNMGIVISPTLPLEFNFRGSCDRLAAVIDRNALSDHLCLLTGDPVTKPIVFQPHLKTGSNLGAHFNRVLKFLVAELDAGDLLQKNSLLASNLEQVMMTALLTEQRHNYSVRFEKPSPLAGDQQVRQVEEYIRAHAEEPISIAKIVAMTGQSERALFRAFKKFRGYTPLNFPSGY